MKALRRIYGADGYRDILGWRHSYAGMSLGVLSLAAAAVGMFGRLPRFAVVGVAAGLVLSGGVDTVVATRWRPAPVRVGHIGAAHHGAEVRVPVDLPKVALFALSGVAFVTCGIGIGIQRGSNPVLLLVTIFFGVVALYFMAVLALARRWALELNEDGFRDRARFRPAASVAWADVESVVARPLALGNQQVVVSLRRSSDRSVIASRLYINSGLLQGGPERVLKAMKQHLRDADGPVS